MKQLASLTTMAFLLGTAFAFAQAPATPDQPTPAPTKTTKKHQKTTKKPGGKKTTTTAPAAQK